MITVLTDAVRRSVGQQAATLKGEKRSGLQVHARTVALPGGVETRCAKCPSPTSPSSTAPPCQTGGKVLADRRMSKLLK